MSGLPVGRRCWQPGINDWGGVSPLTRDWVNPEKAWPHVSALAEVTAAAGFPLLPKALPGHSVLSLSLHVMGTLVG